VMRYILGHMQVHGLLGDFWKYQTAHNFEGT
jgi:hypothetical protein